MKEIIQSDLDRIDRFLDKKITRRDALMWGSLAGIIIFGGISITETLREIIEKSQEGSKEGPAEQPNVPKIATPSRTK